MKTERRRPPICERRLIEPKWQTLQTTELSLIIKVDESAIRRHDLQSELQGLRDELERTHDGLKPNLVSIPLEDLTDRARPVTERKAEPN